MRRVNRIAQATIEDPSIGLRIKLVRVERGKQLKEVAEAAGMQPSQLSRIESSKTDPKWSTVERIARALGLEVSELASKEDETLQRSI